MADDRMKNEQKNMGAGEGQNYGGQQSPGKTGQGGYGQQAGQHAGGQQSGGGQFSGQKGTQNMEDDEDDFGAGRPGQSGSQNRGSQNR